jgi:hypothetical protein
MRRSAAVLALLLAACAAQAQLATPNPDWKEVEAPPPPSFTTDALIPLDIPRTALRFGVDPASISIGPDGVVRYVVVATSTTGAVNAMYEGIRCSTGEFKVYARHNPGGWTVVKDAPWRSLHEQALSRHSLEIARTGACIGRAPNRSASQVARDLRAPADTRFNIN